MDNDDFNSGKNYELDFYKSLNEEKNECESTNNGLEKNQGKKIAGKNKNRKKRREQQRKNAKMDTTLKESKDNSDNKSKILKEILDILSKDFLVDNDDDYDRIKGLLDTVNNDDEYRYNYYEIYAHINPRKYEEDNIREYKEKLDCIMANIELLEKDLKNTGKGKLKKKDEKLIQFIKMEVQRGQKNNLQVEENHKTVEKLNNQTTEINGNIENIKKDLKEQQAESITILGIFSAVVLGFTSGLTFSTSVLESMANTNIYKLLIIICILSFGLINCIYILLHFIERIHYKNNKVQKEDTRSYIDNFDRTIYKNRVINNLKKRDVLRGFITQDRFTYEINDGIRIVRKPALLKVWGNNILKMLNHGIVIIDIIIIIFLGLVVKAYQVDYFEVEKRIDNKIERYEQIKEDLQVYDDLLEEDKDGKLHLKDIIENKDDVEPKATDKPKTTNKPKEKDKKDNDKTDNDKKDE